MIAKLISKAIHSAWASVRGAAHARVGVIILGTWMVLVSIGALSVKYLQNHPRKVDAPPSANVTISRADLAALRTARADRERLQHDLDALQAHYAEDRAAWAAREARYQAELSSMDPDRAAALFTDFNRELAGTPGAAPRR